MVLYFIVLLIPLLAHFLIVPSKNNVLFIGVLTMFFFCFGYMTGSDWRSYELFYENPINTLVSSEYFEPGYLVINNFFKFFGVDFWHWFILVKCFTFFIWLRFLYKYSSNNFFLVLFLFLGSYGAFIFIDNPFRNVLTVSIFLMCYKWIDTGNYWKFLFVMLLALTLHKSVLFIIPFLFLGRLRISSKLMIIIFILSDLLFILNIDLIKDLIVKIGVYLPFFSDRIDAYFVGETTYSSGSPFSLGSLLRTVLFFLIISRRESFVAKYGNVFFNFIFYSFIIYKLALSISILGRLNLYFIPFYCIAVVYLLKLLKDEIKIVIYLSVLFLTIISLYSTITSTYKYLPYTHYLLYGDDPGYNYRYNYNFFNSPYSEGTDRVR